MDRGLCVPGEPLALPQPLAEPDPDAPASSSASAAAGLKAQASVPQPHPPPQWVPKDSPCCLLPPACSARCPQAAGVDGAAAPPTAELGHPCSPHPPLLAWPGPLSVRPSVLGMPAFPFPMGTGQPTGAQSAWHMKELTTFPSYPVPFFVLMTLGRAPCLPLPER